MAKNSQIARWKRPAKFSTRKYNRCNICGRSGGYIRRFQLCRICFRELAIIPMNLQLPFDQWLNWILGFGISLGFGIYW